MAKTTKYCIDSNSLMESMRDRYPIESFPGVWSSIGDAFKSKEIVSSIIVYDEILSGDDDLVEWIKAYKSFFLPVDNAQISEVSRIVNTYQGLVDTKATRESADPYLVAMAKKLGITLVTEEDMVHIQPNTKKIKIPNVCISENVRCIKIVQMIKEFDWKFDR